MKHLWIRLMAALTVCLWTVTAFAADAATDVGAIALQHPVLAIIAPLAATLIRLLQSDVSWAPSALLRYRLLILAGLSLFSGWLDMVINGTGYGAAIVAVLATGAPGLVVEIFHLFSKVGKGGSGSSSADLSDAGTSAKSPQPSSYSATKLMGIGVVFAALAIPGCAGAQKAIHDAGPVLTNVLADVQEATSVIEAIQSIVNVFFLAHPAPANQAKVEKAFADLHLLLDATSRATDGAQSLTQGQSYIAFQKFVLAFKELQTLLGQLGITDSAGRVGTTPGGTPSQLPIPVVVLRAQS